MAGAVNGHESFSLEKHWESTIRQLTELSHATIQQNTTLARKVSTLEEDITVWKQARVVLSESHEVNKRQYEDEIASLKARLAAYENGNTETLGSMLLCVIDAEYCDFSDSLLQAGEEGGRTTAQRMTSAIAQDFFRQNIRVSDNFSFWAQMFIDRKNAQMKYVNGGRCTLAQLEAFFKGFTESSPRCMLVDVSGQDKGSAKMKIDEILQTYVRSPTTIKIYWAGGHSGYASTLTNIHGGGNLHKVVMIKGAESTQRVIENFRLASLEVEALFKARSPSPPQWSNGNLDDSGWAESKSMGKQRERNGFEGLIADDPGLLRNGSPWGKPDEYNRNEPKDHSWRAAREGLRNDSIDNSTNYTSTTSSYGSPKQTHWRTIDPHLPLNKQVPPPCNEHYLMTCPRIGTCKFGHDYKLTQEQLETLAKNAKKAPCNYLRKGLDCPIRKQCCWGHACPKGPTCFHNSQGKCWFKGPNAHLSDAIA